MDQPYTIPKLPLEPIEKLAGIPFNPKKAQTTAQTVAQAVDQTRRRAQPIVAGILLIVAVTVVREPWVVAVLAYIAGHLR